MIAAKVKVGRIWHRWGVGSAVAGLAVLGGLLNIEGTALAYEKAKTPLKATAQQPVSLLKAPEAGSPSLLSLPQDAEVTIIGREKGWFHVEAPSSGASIRGWVPAASVRVLGLSGSAVPAVQASAGKKKEAPPLRVVPYGGYAYGAKDYPSQIRFGADVLWTLWRGTELGFDVGAGFRRVTLFTGGPAVHYRFPWPRGGFVSVAVFGGMSVFHTRRSGSTDTAVGPRMGVECSKRFFHAGPVGVDGLVRVESDLFLFGTNRIQIPLLGAAGFVLRF